MIPLRPASLFRSRWAALLYGAGVLWFAHDVAGGTHAEPSNASAAAGDSANASDGAAAASDADVAALENQVHAFEALK